MLENATNEQQELDASPRQVVLQSLNTDNNRMIMNDDDIRNRNHPTNDNPQTTTQVQTFLHLVKGYIGPGCLSLPWAISQLGIPVGCLACCLMSYWTSYNCWTVVRLKRLYMQELEEEQQQQEEEEEESEESEHEREQLSSVSGHHYHHQHHHHHQHITYPQVAKWLYGKRLEQFTTLCICVQQLSVCTVFLSFVGANLQAVLEDLCAVQLSHAMVVTLVTPAAAALSLLPNLKSLAPATAIGTALLLLGLLFLSIVIGVEWNDRPQQQQQPVQLDWFQAPLALCAILYSYEGICLILPVESAMTKPKRFSFIFVNAMIVAAAVFCAVAGFSVAAFGKVTNGSITAFLLEAYETDSEIQGLLLAANAAVSLSVLVTYPLQLFPCLELVANSQWSSRRRRTIVPQRQGQNAAAGRGDYFVSVRGSDFVAAEHILTDESISETSSSCSVIGSPPSSPMQQQQQQQDGLMMIQQTNDGIMINNNNNDDDDSSTAATSLEHSWKTRLQLVFLTYAVAVAIPNVQALISLAGALAGSSTALLIPPVLQIASYRRQQQQQQLSNQDSGGGGGSGYGAKCSVYQSYFLFGCGLVFLVIGTGASMADIVQVYLSA